MTIKSDPAQRLPSEIELFSYLNPSELIHACQVSKKWRAQALLDPRIVTSFEEVISRLNTFLDQTKPNQNRSFECIFPNNPDFTISAELNPDGAIRRREVCVFVGRLPPTAKKCMTSIDETSHYSSTVRLPRGSCLALSQKVVSILKEHSPVSIKEPSFDFF